MYLTVKPLIAATKFYFYLVRMNKAVTNKTAFETLGCKLNFSETSSMRRDFLEAGYVEKNFKNLQIYT